MLLSVLISGDFLLILGVERKSSILAQLSHLYSHLYLVCPIKFGCCLSLGFWLEHCKLLNRCSIIISSNFIFVKEFLVSLRILILILESFIQRRQEQKLFLLLVFSRLLHFYFAQVLHGY